MECLSSPTKPLTTKGWAALCLLTKREFYEGELDVVNGDSSRGYTLEKAMAYPILVTRVESDCEFSYRRSSKHIRMNKVGTRLIWFVKHGTLKLVRSSGITRVNPGELAIVNTSTPFQAFSECDDDGHFESFQVLVPSDLFLTHLKTADRFCEALSLDSPDGELTQRLLRLIVAHGEQFNRSISASIAVSLLEAIGQCIGQERLHRDRREKLIDKRFAEIEAYILMNVTDPDLSYDKVAINCGVSPRYLCYLLKAQKTSFSELLWKNRLPKARDWLISPETQDHPIHEISFMAGFKSAAHFSRMFKETYGCSPSIFRSQHKEMAEQGEGGESREDLRCAA